MQRGEFFWNMPQFRRAHATDWSIRFAGVLEDVIAAGHTWVRFDLGVTRPDGPTVPHDDTIDHIAWAGTQLGRSGLKVVATVLAWVSNVANWRALQVAATGESDATVQAGLVQTWTQTAGIHPAYYDALATMLVEELRVFVDAYVAAGGDERNVIIQLGNEAGYAGVALPTNHNTYMQTLVDAMEAEFPHSPLCAQAYYGDSALDIWIQASSTSGAWMRKLSYCSINRYMASGSKAAARAADRLWEGAAVLINLFKRPCIVTETAQVSTLEASRESGQIRAAAVYQANPRNIVGTSWYTRTAHPDDRGDDYSMILWNNVRYNVDPPTIPEDQ